MHREWERSPCPLPEHRYQQDYKHVLISIHTHSLSLLFKTFTPPFKLLSSPHSAAYICLLEDCSTVGRRRSRLNPVSLSRLRKLLSVCERINVLGDLQRRGHGGGPYDIITGSVRFPTKYWRTLTRTLPRTTTGHWEKTSVIHMQSKCAPRKLGFRAVGEP